jgi:uncharacterized membrane protein
MADNKKFNFSLVAINKNEYVKKIQTYGDRLADLVTNMAGSTAFLVLNVVWFTTWILINTGTFGEELIFDEYPFGFLTMVVSLEAIILAVFVLISQNRQSERQEARSELDYIIDLQADAEVSTIITILERLADKQNIAIDDLLDDLSVTQKKILKEHKITRSAEDK